MKAKALLEEFKALKIGNDIMGYSELTLTKKQEIDEAICELEDFESRTCENCMHNKEQDNFMIFCDCVMCLDGSRMMWHSYTKDFCCNKWEKKDER